ncbi:hypothetical protein Tco_0864534, partial [Tanacetum coccineum]
MTDSRPVLEQYNELLGILGTFTQHKMNMDEAIQVSCIIDKLPSSLKDFKHTFKHLKEELTLIELDSPLRIEESLRVQDSDKPKGNNVVGPQKNLVSNRQFIECILIGYVEHFKAFRLCVIEPNESDLINSIIKSRDAIFHENKLSSVPRPSQRYLINGTKDIDGSVVLEKFTDEYHKTSFLNGDLDEKVYINQPQGFIMPGNEDKVDLKKEFLSSRFFMKDMEEANVILGIRIKHESNGIAISQSHYIEM